MARSESESEFDRMMVQNQQMLLASGGQTSPYRPISAEVGPYYGRIISGQRDVVNQKVKTPTGEDTGQTQKAQRVQLRFVIVCSSDPKCPPEHREQFSGAGGFFQYTLTPNDQEAWNRLSGDLETIGIRTRNLVPSEQHIRQPGVQLTMEQALQIITNARPFCQLEVTPGKTGGKFTNFRDSASQADVERMMGHAVNEAVFQQAAQPAEPQYLDPSQVGQPQPGQPMIPQYGTAPGPQMIPGQPVNSPLTGLPIPGQPMPGQPMGMPMPGQMAPAPVLPVAGPPVYPAAGAPFAGDQANLEWQAADNMWFDKFSKHYYSREGQYIPVAPQVPQPPVTPMTPAIPVMPMPTGMPQPMGGPVASPQLPVGNPMIPPWQQPPGQYSAVPSR